MSKNIIRRYPLPESSFMCGWILPEEVINNLLDKFKEGIKTDLGHTGFSGGKIRTEIKDSYDIGLSPHIFDAPFGDYRDYLQKCLEDYCNIFEHSNKVRHFDICENINLQYYKPGGGFKKWHFENSGMGKRVLVFMTYLNDLSDEGGTEFLYQNLKIKPQKGLTLIWPAGWTHTHRGIVSKTQTKYIATGWYSFVE